MFSFTVWTFFGENFFFSTSSGKKSLIGIQKVIIQVFIIFFKNVVPFESLTLYHALDIINPFVPSAPFFYLLKAEKPYGFLMFSGVREGVHLEQMG